MRALVLVALCLGCHLQEPQMTIVDHGIPVRTARQWTTGLTPNAAGTGWNYIAAVWNGSVSTEVEWSIVKNFTTSPTTTIVGTGTHNYPNSNWQYTNQMRAANGRIFFPRVNNRFAYYDPTTETIGQLGPVVETPPVDPNASTQFFMGRFDTAGMIYFTTQESQNRPSMVVSLDPDTLAITILGYVGSGATGYTTYGYWIAPDTGTSQKYVYVAYGQSPWQLWALNITPGPNYGTATKLYEVSSTGTIQFTDIPGKGWRATIHTNLGSPSNVITYKWCIDGALYDYTAGIDPPSPRNVTPYSNPLVSPPQIDTSLGSGVLAWRPNGSSGDYTYVNYTVNNRAPIKIESLVASNDDDGIVGNTLSYNGFFQDDGASPTWYGTYPMISRGPRLNVDGLIYAAGYPNGVLVRYNPDATWQSGTNPTLIGYYGPTGTQYAGIKYSDFMAWAPLAGTDGQLYVAGSRERNGVGSGIGAWKRGTSTFIGTYSATGMDTVTPSGLVVLGNMNRVVMASSLISGSGSAPLFVFDYDLNLISTLTPMPGVANLGQIYETQTPNVITGIVQGAGNSVGLWQYNVQTQTLIDYVELPITGDIQPSQAQSGHKVYLIVDTDLVRVDVTTLTGEVVQDLSSIAPIDTLGFAANGTTLYMGADTNEGVAGAQLYSLNIDDVLVLGNLAGAGTLGSLTMSVNGNASFALGSLDGTGVAAPMIFDVIGSVTGRTGANTATLQNDEGSTMVFGQPIYASGDGKMRLASADDTVIGLVGMASVASLVFGRVAVEGVLVGTTAQWDAVCGTTGGLTHGTTYYADPSVPGRLTSTPPTVSGKVQPVIRALSPLKARILITPAVTL